MHIPPMVSLRCCRVYAPWETEQLQTKHPILVVRSMRRQIGVNTRVILGLVAASVALIALVALIFLTWPSGGTARAKPLNAQPTRGHSTLGSPEPQASRGSGAQHQAIGEPSGDTAPKPNRGHTPQTSAGGAAPSSQQPVGTAPKASDRIGSYEIEKEIQPIIEGWTSLTYLAKHRSEGNQVVLKLANPGSPIAERLEVERQIYALSLAGVPRLLDAGSDAGFDYIVTERIHSVDLRTHIDRNGVLNAAEAVAIGLQVCESMEALHSHQWLHCDLTPANLLIDKQDRVHLIDFGLAVEFGADSPAGISGTPSFLSPEIINQAPLVPASDIYSFGCVLYFMLMGQKPYSGNTSIETLWKQSKGPLPTFPSDLPISQGMQELVHRCLLKNPADRPESFGELKQLLQGLS